METHGSRNHTDIKYILKYQAKKVKYVLPAKHTKKHEMNSSEIIAQDSPANHVKSVYRFHTHEKNNRYFNYWTNTRKVGFLDIIKWQFEKISSSIKDTSHFENYFQPPHVNPDSGEIAVTFIGHSTVLIKMGGLTILTDPFFSNRASPIGFMGPKRVVEARPNPDEIGKVDIVLISHDHYDHLDNFSIKKLGNNPQYFIPLGVKKIMNNWGVTGLIEMDWGQVYDNGNIKLTCWPAQHFSGRNAGHRNNTLWCSWSLMFEGRTIYFVGDSGYGQHFKWIADSLGQIDVAFLPIGATHPVWIMRPVHTNAEEAVQAFLNLRALNAVPIHWGTVKLSDEPLDEPPRLFVEELRKKDIVPSRFPVVKHGMTVIF